MERRGTPLKRLPARDAVIIGLKAGVNESHHRIEHELFDPSCCDRDSGERVIASLRAGVTESKYCSELKLGDSECVDRASGDTTA
jgi:hypothetical protein